MEMTGNRAVVFYLFIGISCVYFLTSALNNIDITDQSQVRFATTLSIVEDSDLSLPNGMGVKGRNGKDYSWYGIGQPVLAIPFYVIGKSVGGQEGAKLMVSLLNLLAVSLSCVIVFLFIVNLGYSSKAALTVSIFYAFGTFAWPQSKHPFDHPVEMLFVLLSVFYIHGYIKTGLLRYLLLSSFALGFAFLTRMPAVLALFPVVLYLFFGLKKGRYAFKQCVCFFTALAPFVAIQLWYNYARFGSIFETGITLMAERAGIDFFAGTQFIDGIRGFLISPGKGFFFYSPITILFLVSIRNFYKRNKGVALCFLGISLSYLIFLSRNIYWHGDWSWGPRYLFVITPLLMIPIADLVEKGFRKKTAASLVYGLFLVSIIVQIIGISIDFNRYFFSLQVEKGIRFTVVGGKDTPYIIEPTRETHFDWGKSPIIYNTSAMFETWNRMKGYVYQPERTVRGNSEVLKYHIRFNVLDFWWVYAIYGGAPPIIVLPVVSILFFVISFSGYRIYENLS